MILGRGTRLVLTLTTIATLVFIYVPIALIFTYAFNDAPSAAWPPAGFTLRWFGVALENTALQQAFLTSIVVPLGPTVIPLAPGTDQSEA